VFRPVPPPLDKAADAESPGRFLRLCGADRVYAGALCMGVVAVVIGIVIDLQ
jgi:hypothetical protein